MRSRHPSLSMLLLAHGIVACAGLPPVATAQQSGPLPTEGKALTVERIYSQPSLSGRLTRGLAWTPRPGNDGFLLLLTNSKLFCRRKPRDPRKPPGWDGARHLNINGHRMALESCFKAPRRWRGWM